jgi:hypothetical protein
MPFNSSEPEFEGLRFAPKAAVRMRESQKAHALVDDPDIHYYARALIYGTVCALIGTAGYAVFVGATGVRWGYITILVAMLIAKAMTIGSQERGGEGYQVTAVVLAYLSTAIAHSLLTWWTYHLAGPVTFNIDTVLKIARYGLLFPVYLLNGPLLPGVFRLAIHFVGWRAAWRMTSGGPEETRHPFITPKSH